MELIRTRFLLYLAKDILFIDSLAKEKQVLVGPEVNAFSFCWEGVVYDALPTLISARI